MDKEMEMHRNLPIWMQEPSDDMWDAGRSAVMARDCSRGNWTPGQHYDASGISVKGIPAAELTGHGMIPKEQGAALVWYGMLGQRPNPENALVELSPKSIEHILAALQQLQLYAGLSSVEKKTEEWTTEVAAVVDQFKALHEQSTDDEREQAISE